MPSTSARSSVAPDPLRRTASSRVPSSELERADVEIRDRRRPERDAAVVHVHAAADERRASHPDAHLSAPLPRRRSTPSPRRPRRAATGRSSLAAAGERRHGQRGRRRAGAQQRRGRSGTRRPAGRAGPPRYQRNTPSGTTRVPPRRASVRRSNRAARGDPPEHRDRDRAGAGGGEQLHPADARVAARAEGVHERDRPRGVGEPVHRPPRSQPEPPAQQARHASARAAGRTRPCRGRARSAGTGRRTG